WVKGKRSCASRPSACAAWSSAAVPHIPNTVCCVVASSVSAKARCRGLGPLALRSRDTSATLHSFFVKSAASASTVLVLVAALSLSGGRVSLLFASLLAQGIPKPSHGAFVEMDFPQTQFIRIRQRNDGFRPDRGRVSIQRQRIGLVDHQHSYRVPEYVP